MEPNEPSTTPSATWSASRTTDSELLDRTRAHLELRAQGLEPSPLLVEAWERFYRHYSPLVRRFALACRVPDGELEDCIQDVWKALVVELRKFSYDPQKGRFRSWLYRVVQSRAQDLVRRRTRCPECALSSDAATALPSPQPDPAAHFERLWQEQLLQTALAELTAATSGISQQVLRMLLVDGRSAADVAAALGITAEQVRYRSHRLRQKLRRLVAMYTGDDLPLTG